MRARLLLAALIASAIGLSCNGSALEVPAPDAGPPPGGLTPEQASQVVAKVGDRTITLGDFAAALERMDPYDRLRYQSKERRRELLQEIVDVELLAGEARRRGLDKDPGVEDAIRQILRDAMLAKAREGLPTPGEIPLAEVKAYFEQNPEKFREPERRRVSVILLDDKKKAEQALEAARKATTVAEWGEIFTKFSLNAPPAKKGGHVDPGEALGDLGLVGPPNDPKGGNARVPTAIRAIVFQLAKAGDVHESLVEGDGKFYVVRLSGVTPPHARSFGEAERNIRVTLVQQKLEEREKGIEAELRKKFPVTIDEKALGAVPVPPIPDATSGASRQWASPSASASASASAPDAGP